jgi:alpha-ketoglutaric semialdehyde dehydrogenase
MLHGKNVIAGQLSAAAGATFRARDAATGAALEPAFHEATAAEAARAVDAAAEAFSDYRRRPAEDRARFLDTIADGIEALGDTLIARTTTETGLPAARIIGERARTCAQLRLFAALAREGSWVDARIDTALPERQPVPRPDIRRMLKPVGPVVVFGASNFPLAFSTAGGDTASALAAGCPVVVKAHPAHPGCGELVAGAIARAAAACGLPRGVFSFVHGGPAIGIALVQHPATAAVGFTGSHAAGRALFDAASARPKPIPVFAEMSSVNPVFVLPGALRERGAAIAQGLLGSFTLGVGQFCTKPGVVFALRGPDTDAFVATLAGAVRHSASGTMLTTGIRAAFERARADVTAVEGVSVVAASPAASADRATSASPSIAATDAAQFLSQPKLTTEVFGPFALVVYCENADEMLACAQALDGQLTATLHGTEADLATAGKLLEAAEDRAGRVIVNGFPTGVEVSPAMNHGGPYPATTDVRFTSVGTAAILRFARPVCYQGFAEALLPPELKNANPRNILRTLNGALTRDAVSSNS